MFFEVHYDSKYKCNAPDTDWDTKDASEKGIMARSNKKTILLNTAV